MAKNSTVAMNDMSVGRHRHRQRHPRAAQGVDRHRAGARIERREIGGPGPHAARENHPRDRWIGMDMTHQNPIPQPAAEPVHRRETHPHQDPDPVDAPERLNERGEVVAIQQDPDVPQDRDADEDEEPAEEQARAEDGSHWGSNLVFFPAHVVPRSAHRQRPAAQPEGCHGRPASPGAGRRHRPQRLGEEFSGLRHAVRRGAAALHRVALHLRQAVPRADAQAAGGPARGTRACRRHRAAQSHRLQPFHGRHRHRDLRLPPPALGPGRPPAVPALRQSRPSRLPAIGGARHRPSGARPGTGHVPARPVRETESRGDRGESRRPGFRAGAGRWRAAAPGGIASRTRSRRRERTPGGGRSPDPRPGADDGATLGNAPARRSQREPGRRAALPAAPGHRDRVYRGRRHRRRAAPGRAAALHRTAGLQPVRHPGCHGDARALLVQQPSRRLPDLQRLRRRPRVRRVPHRSGPHAESRRRRHRSVDQATLRDSPPPAPHCRPGAWRRPGQALVEAHREAAARAAARKAGALPRHLSLPQGTRGEALQAVHPGVPSAVPARQALLRLRRRPAQPGCPGGPHRGRADFSSLGSFGGPAASLARGPRAHRLRAPGRRTDRGPAAASASPTCATWDSAI